MRLIHGVAFAALLAAGHPAAAGFFLDRSPSGVDLAATEYRVMKPRAEAGVASSLYFTGLYRYFGLGAEQDRAEGLDLIRRAADAGIEGAMRFLGFYYGSGLGPAIDLAESAKWYAAADEGWVSGRAARRFGFSFGEGTITISGPSIQAYQRDAEQGVLPAILRLAVRRPFGDIARKHVVARLNDVGASHLLFGIR